MKMIASTDNDLKMTRLIYDMIDSWKAPALISEIIKRNMLSNPSFLPKRQVPKPVQYKISAPASLTDRIKYILMCAASDEQDILKEMNVHMSFSMI